MPWHGLTAIETRGPDVHPDVSNSQISAYIVHNGTSIYQMEICENLSGHLVDHYGFLASLLYLL